jgi:hypothetical protein
VAAPRSQKGGLGLTRPFLCDLGGWRIRAGTLVLMRE